MDIMYNGIYKATADFIKSETYWYNCSQLIRQKRNMFSHHWLWIVETIEEDVEPKLVKNYFLSWPWNLHDCRYGVSEYYGKVSNKQKWREDVQIYTTKKCCYSISDGDSTSKYLSFYIGYWPQHFIQLILHHFYKL